MEASDQFAHQYIIITSSSRMKMQEVQVALCARKVQTVTRPSPLRWCRGVTIKQILVSPLALGDM